MDFRNHHSNKRFFLMKQMNDYKKKVSKDNERKQNEVSQKDLTLDEWKAWKQDNDRMMEAKESDTNEILTQIKYEEWRLEEERKEKERLEKEKIAREKEAKKKAEEAKREQERIRIEKMEERKKQIALKRLEEQREKERVEKERALMDKEDKETKDKIRQEKEIIRKEKYEAHKKLMAKKKEAMEIERARANHERQLMTEEDNIGKAIVRKEKERIWRIKKEEWRKQKAIEHRERMKKQHELMVKHREEKRLRKRQKVSFQLSSFAGSVPKSIVKTVSPTIANENIKLIPHVEIFHDQDYIDSFISSDIIVSDGLKRKVKLFHNIIYNEVFDISKLSCVLPEKLYKSNNILLVGNGPIYNNISEILPIFDVIIRFNDYYANNPHDMVGTKTNIQFCCIPPTITEFNGWINDAECIIPLEVNNPHRYNMFTDNQKEKIILPNMEYMKNIYKLNCDLTRGFFAILFCLQVKERINNLLNIYIIGYGGSGHHFFKDWRMYHDHKSEMVILHELKKKGKIIDLNESIL